MRTPDQNKAMTDLRRKALIQRIMARVLPRDPDNVDRPGAFGVYFEGALWWIFEEDFDNHDTMYERIYAGLTDLTYRKADEKFIEALKKKLELNREHLTGAQYRWAKLCINGAWVACRSLNVVRGDV